MDYIQNIIIGAIDTELNGRTEDIYLFSRTESRSVKGSKIREKRSWNCYPPMQDALKQHEKRATYQRENVRHNYKCAKAPIPKPMRIGLDTREWKNMDGDR